MKILNSPQPNVAKNQLVALQTCTTQIKELIIKGASQEEITKVIDEYCNRFKNEATRKAFKRALVISTNRMLYQYNTNMNVINQTFINRSVKALQVGTGTQLKNKTYNTSALAMYQEYLTGNVSQREIIDKFRNTLNNGRKGLAIIEDYQKKVRDQIKLLSSDPMQYVDKNGKTISLRNKAEMSVRYEANMNDLNEFKQDGTKLVWTSSHADASPRCEHLQGRLWSLDGTRGKTEDGIEYRPIEEALNENGGNSIINGYNCRHYLIEYESGSKPPQHYTRQEIRKEYAIDQRQRQYENRIRQEKTEARLLRANGDKEEADRLQKHYQTLEEKYKRFSLDNGRAYYRWRCQVMNEE